MKHMHDTVAIAVTNSGAHFEITREADGLFRVYRTSYEGNGYIQKVGGMAKMLSGGKTIAQHYANLCGVEIIEFVRA